MFGYKQLMVLFSVVLLLFLSACTKVNPAEDIYMHLEKAVSLEKVFEAQQAPLTQAENEEYELYDQILNLSDMDEINELVTKVEGLAVSRKEMIEQERGSIEEAYHEFLLIVPIVETIENVDLQSVANELVDTMQNRFDSYQNLYQEYKKAIDLDMELYELIKKEDLTIEELERQHEKVNTSYKQVNEFKEQFNNYTLQYNDLKRDFYEKAKLDVVYK